MTGTRNNSKNVSGVKAASKVSKQKILLPTLKEQQRYVVYKIITKNPINKFNSFDVVHNNIMTQCNSMLGIFDGGKAGLMSAKYNAEKMTGVIRVNNKYVDKLKVCLGLIKNITIKDNTTHNNTTNNEVIVDCIYVSGMLHKAVDKMDA